MTSDLHRTVRDAEEALLTSAVRRDHARVDALLHPDFVEIGRSGRLWTRDEILDALAVEPARPDPATDEWRFRELAPALVLVTYRISSPARLSRHASVWDVAGPTPRIRFHQGTIVTGGAAG